MLLLLAHIDPRDEFALKPAKFPIVRMIEQKEELVLNLGGDSFESIGRLPLWKISRRPLCLNKQK